MTSRTGICLALLLLLSCCCGVSSIADNYTEGLDPFSTAKPESITWRCEVLNDLPFARVTEITPGVYNFSGVQPDMLEAIKEFAAEDGIDVTFELDKSPKTYNDAFNLIASDCNTTDNPNPKEDCEKYDLCIADFYNSPSRSLRADLSPSWYKTAISALKKIEKENLTDVTTLKQAKIAGVPVCILAGTYYSRVVSAANPDIDFIFCPSQDECLQQLRQEDCALYVDDELQSRYNAVIDPDFTTTPESFNTQYFVWAFKDNTPHVRWLDKWIYQLVSSGTMDELFFKYFSKALCPAGTAGENCELPCDPDHGESDLAGKCQCVSAKWTGDDCSIEVLEEMNRVPPALKIVAYAMFGISCLVIAICLGWLGWKRSTVEVRVLQPLFLCLVLLGCLISSSTILVMTQDDEDGTVPNCQLIPWLYSIGFCITFGTLFAKIRRTYLLFKSAVDMRRVKVTAGETVCVIGAVLLADIVILVTWTVTDPLVYRREIINTDIFGEPLESQGFCTSENWIIFASLIGVLHLGLLLAACVLCYFSRKISSAFQEGKYLSIAMVSNLQIFVVGVPVLILVGSDPVTGFLLRTAIVWINDLAVVVLIFGHLMYLVHWGPKEETMGGAVNKAIKKYTFSRNSKAQVSSQFGRDSGEFGSKDLGSESLQFEAKKNPTGTNIRQLSYESTNSNGIMKSSVAEHPEKEDGAKYLNAADAFLKRNTLSEVEASRS
mmetsp:Transcript_28462/g.69038  ORF Transcript_28462/g.69038 Transcript_28462/m.69038 type:complete len:719 (+) Transcript_28462:29-2185(+)